MSIGKKFGIAFIATSLLYSAVTPSIVFANEEEEITSGTVTVTATRSTKDLLEVPMAISVIDAEEIEKKAALSLSDLLQEIPGVELNPTTSPNNDRIQIRGSNQVLILIDGQKVSDFHVDNVEFSVDPSMIERIEVIKGPASVLYGSDAMGGVVNIITKKGGDKPLQGEARTAYSSVTNGTINNLSVYGSQNNFSYRLGGAYEKHGDYKSAVNGKIANTAQEVYDFNGYLDYAITDTLTAGALFDTYTEEYHYSTTNSENHRDKVAAFVEGRNIFGFLPKLRVDGFYQDFEAKTSTFSGTTVSARNVRPITSLGFTLQTDLAFGDHTFVVAGYDFLNESLDQKDITYATQTLYREASQTSNAAFASIEHYLPANFTINYGVRFTQQTNEITNSNIVKNDGTVSFNTPASKKSESEPVFNVGVVWTGIDDLALRAQFAQGYRAPTIYETIDISAMGGMATLRPDPNLKSETSDNFEIGARYSANNLDVDLSVFYNDAKDFIEWDMSQYTSSNRVVIVKNLDSVYTYGAELAVNYEFENGITPYGEVSYLHRESKRSGTYTQSTNVPEVRVKVGMMFEKSLFEDYLALNGNVYIFRQSHSGYSLNPGGVVKPFTTVNASFGGEWGDNKEFFAQAEVQNIFDEEYQIHSTTSYYEAGTNASLVLGYRF